MLLRSFHPSILNTFDYFELPNNPPPITSDIPHTLTHTHTHSHTPHTHSTYFYIHTQMEIEPHFLSKNSTKGKQVLFNQIGRLLTVDLMINNSDRFSFNPIWTHEDTNWGNLLIAQDSTGIFSIDHALATITNEKGLKDYCKKVKQFLETVAKSPTVPVKEIKDLASHFKKRLNLEIDERGQKSIQLGVIEALAQLSLVGYTGHITGFLHSAGLKVRCNARGEAFKSTKQLLEQVLKVFQGAYSIFSKTHSSVLKTSVQSNALANLRHFS